MKNLERKMFEAQFILLFANNEDVQVAFDLPDLSNAPVSEVNVSRYEVALNRQYSKCIEFDFSEDTDYGLVVDVCIVTDTAEGRKRESLESFVVAEVLQNGFW